MNNIPDRSNKELFVDIMYVAKRQKALEDAISEWGQFITEEILKTAMSTMKLDKKTKDSLKYTFKKRVYKYD